MKVAISIPDPVFEAADELAKRQGKSRSQLYAEAVADYVKDHRTCGVTEKLDAVYGTEKSVLDEATEQAQFDSLEDESW